MTEQTHDIIIVGGGPVGLTLALSFVRFLGGARIALVDRRPFTVPDDKRAYALTASVVRIFTALGLWAELLPEAQPINGMRITDSGTADISRPLFLTFAGDVAPGEPFAHMVPNRVLTAALLNAVGGAVKFVAPASVTGFTGTGGAGVLELGDGRVLAAPLVVAADGAQSALRGMAGIETVGHDYRQAGIVTTITHELHHDGIAYEHFLPAGPFASLPLPGGFRSSLVWTDTLAAADRLKALPLTAAADLIEAAMGATLGAVTVEETLQSFPLRLQLAKRFIGPRLALIGDSAHVIHPVAGQGLNLGLKDAAALAEIAIEALRLGLDPGVPEMLERYERWRRMDTAVMAMVTDQMNRLFSNDIAPVRALRDFGLGLVDRVPPVKDFMIRNAAGLTNRGPRLVAGQPI
ncbi:MAG: 2-octaprenyl-6-methoxyphenol hydroxylase [Devosia sp.]|nr:2-octaprenyl-6-methoxyphenol hydroxylase [Devosia sp.]